MKNELIYSLNENDAQTVAMAELGRELNDSEMSELKDKLPERVNWYDAILYTILDIKPSDQVKQ